MNLCDTNLSPACQQKLRERLFDDEKLLWVGQPVPEPWASPAGFFVFFGAFCVISLLYVLCSVGSPAMAFALIPFIGMLFAPLVNKWMQQRTVYAITNQRARVLRYTALGYISLSFVPVPGMIKSWEELPGGLVNLVLGKNPYVASKRGGSMKLVPEGFLRITAADAEKVLPLIRQLESTQSR
jgi:hypothetical protein